MANEKKKPTQRAKKFQSRGRWLRKYDRNDPLYGREGRKEEGKGKVKKVKKRVSALKRAPEVYKIHSQQLSKEGLASKGKGTLRQGKSQFRKDIDKTINLLNPITAARKIAKSSQKIASKVAPKIVKRYSEKKKERREKVKRYFGYRHGGGILEQHD
tara:strand:- start:256 stop:726 length:471 start_codon:yes stop_codon:yes gene_type:complete